MRNRARKRHQHTRRVDNMPELSQRSWPNNLLRQRQRHLPTQHHHTETTEAHRDLQLSNGRQNTKCSRTKTANPTPNTTKRRSTKMGRTMGELRRTRNTTRPSARRLLERGDKSKARPSRSDEKVRLDMRAIYGS